MLNQDSEDVKMALNREPIANKLLRMKLSAANASTALLTGTQVGISKNLMVIHKLAREGAWFND